MIDFDKDVILDAPPREQTNIGWEKPVRVSFDGAEGNGRVWLADDADDTMIAIPGDANCRRLAGLLLAWASASNANGLPLVGSMVKLKDGQEVEVLCHARHGSATVAIVQDGELPRVCLAAAFEDFA